MITLPDLVALVREADADLPALVRRLGEAELFCELRLPSDVPGRCP